MSGTVALFGLEVIKLGDLDDGSPHRMTVDVFDGTTVRRYQVTGHYNGWPDGPPERTIEEIARFTHGGSEDERMAMATELDKLDREAAAKVLPIMEELFRAQVKLIHGQDTLDWLDREEAKKKGA